MKLRKIFREADWLSLDTRLALEVIWQGKKIVEPHFASRTNTQNL